MENWEINNNEAFMMALAEIDPQLWRIKSKLLQRRINSDFIPEIIEMIAHVYRGTGQGTVEIVINQGKVETVKGHSNRKIDISIE